MDRNQVLENTKANAKLHEAGAAIINGREESAENRAQHEKLQWDEAKLYLDEQERTATMKITEPKTPYQGAVGDSEYYQEDEDEDPTANGEPNDLEDFSLGEPEIHPKKDPTVENYRIERVDVDSGGNGEQEEEDHELTPEEKHKRFEEMRKAHYYMRGVPLKKNIVEEEEEDEEDGEE